VAVSADATRFWLIRHAESTWNAEARWQGQLDPPLSSAGRAQAERLARELADSGLELLVASDLRRSIDTAAPLARRLGLELRLDPRLRELDAGNWAGLVRGEIARRDAAALARFDAGDPEVRAGGGECRREVAARARSALCALAAAAPGRRIAVVTHGGLVRCLLPGARLANAEWLALPAAALERGECAAVPASPAPAAGEPAL
jgi:probable phosphoglycerate mutase